MPSNRRVRHQNESASIALRTLGGRFSGSNSSGSEAANSRQRALCEYTREKLTDVRGEEHLKERCNKIIDPLNVSTGGMSDRPYIQYSFDALGRFVNRKTFIIRGIHILSVSPQTSIVERRAEYAERLSQFDAKFVGRGHLCPSRR